MFGVEKCPSESHLLAALEVRQAYRERDDDSQNPFYANVWFRALQASETELQQTTTHKPEYL